MVPTSATRPFPRLPYVRIGMWCLVIGFSLSVAFAAALAYFTDVAHSDPVSLSTLERPASFDEWVEHIRYVERHSFGARLWAIASMHFPRTGNKETSGYLLPFPRLPAPMLDRCLAKANNWSGLAEAAYGGESAAVARVFAYGIPFPALTWSEAGFKIYKQAAEVQETGAIRLGSVHPGSRHERMLPYLPIWPGLTANTLFWAFALYLPLATFAALRRRRRIRRECCPACNYDKRGLTTSAPCPECGAPGGR